MLSPRQGNAGGHVATGVPSVRPSCNTLSSLSTSSATSPSCSIGPCETLHGTGTISLTAHATSSRDMMLGIRVMTRSGDLPGRSKHLNHVAPPQTFARLSLSLLSLCPFPSPFLYPSDSRFMIQGPDLTKNITQAQRQAEAVVHDTPSTRDAHRMRRRASHRPCGWAGGETGRQCLSDGRRQRRRTGASTHKRFSWS
jgi:hypothetical protein